MPAVKVDAAPFDYRSAPKERVLRCNLCGEGTPKIIATRDRYGYLATSNECRRCGLVWLSPRMTPGAYAAFYEDGYRPLVSWYHGREINAQTLQEEQEAYAWALSQVLGNGDRSILDVGGSTGVVSRLLAGKVRPTVLDPAPAELAEATGLETIRGTIEGFEPDGRTWDLVLVCQALDHFLDPSGALERLWECCSGRLWVDIVDWRKVAKAEGSIELAMKIDHPFAFTPDTARRLLRKWHFTVEEEVPAVDGVHHGFVCS